MPSLTFVLPHWLYWSGLAVFPLIAMAMVRRQRAVGVRPGVSLALGYMLLVTSGFVGLHRFYLRSWLGLLYLPLFVGILYANAQGRAAREVQSLAETDQIVAAFDLEQAEKAQAQGVEGAEAKLATARAAMAAAKARASESQATFGRWSSTARYLAIAIAILLLVDAAMLPRLTRWRNEIEARAPPPPEEPVSEAVAAPPEDPALKVSTPFTAALETLSRYTGEFVTYWSVIAVFAYYYEVVARYIFNSPTNWVHESMFLMFGMQYLISGAYAYMTDSHVRVDVFYARMPDRAKALADLLTSVFFFIFAGTILWTGFIFLRDAVGVWEVSFTEWAIQYWPVKATIALGAVLILLQGVAKLLKDIRILFRSPLPARP